MVLEANITSLSEEGVDISIRKVTMTGISRKPTVALKEHEHNRTEEAAQTMAALNTVVTGEEEKPLSEGRSQDGCARCWSWFTNCFHRTTRSIEGFLNQIETYYPIAKTGLENVLVWSEDVALFFDNPKLAKKIDSLSKKGGRYADIAERYLQIAGNSAVLLRKVSETLKVIKLESKDDFFAKVRAQVPTLFRLASDVKNGTYAYQNKDGDLEFFAKRGDTESTLRLSLDTNLVELLATDYEEAERAGEKLGFVGENLKTWTQWKKSFNAASLGIGAQMKEALINLGDSFAKISAVKMDHEVGAVSFFPPSTVDSADAAPVFVVRLPGYESSWMPKSHAQADQV
jgi:hypothetical protein